MRFDSPTGAYEEIDAIVGYIARDSPQAAIRWREAVFKKAASLANFPQSHGLAPEAHAMGVDVRQTFHGAYRILDVVGEREVVIHGVRHGARLPLTSEEFPERP
ncbi:MAG TPA: type II toxin-antitoxin system RelE/ParE family toxin [Lacipirellulaceae bacterium]|nr:type II toxin-antitoxin system RelE/ParE family toxin [Lacipirellulaceae bacterium]